MYIHFTTQNFKHNTESYGYVGSPGLVNNGTRKNEIFCGCYVDVDGCYITDGNTYEDTYKPFSFHGFVPLRKDTDNDDRLYGIIFETDSRLWALEIAGRLLENDGGFIEGKAVNVSIFENTK